MEAYFFTLHGEKITYNLLIRKKYILGWREHCW